MFSITSYVHLSPAISVQVELLGTLMSPTMPAHQRHVKQKYRAWVLWQPVQIQWCPAVEVCGLWERNKV